jgi:hypothetical protein
VDFLTLQEYHRLLPSHCAAIKATLPSANYLLFEASLTAANTIKNLALGITKEETDLLNKALSPIGIAAFSSAFKYFFIRAFAPQANHFEFIAEPGELIAPTQLELCLIISASMSLESSNGGEPFSSSLSILIPRGSIIELFPDIFREYYRPGPGYRVSKQEIIAGQDTWFKRYFEFPLPNTDITKMKKAMEKQNLSNTSIPYGRTNYREV